MYYTVPKVLFTRKLRVRASSRVTHAFYRNLNLTASKTVSSYTDAVTYTVLVLLVHTLPVEVGAAASTEEVGET